jgi:S1-C subfamily serine protease
VRRVRASVVRITANACGLGVEGSGWVARPHIVVTAAHVVAGGSSIRAGGLAARALFVDRKQDIAVLRVPGLRAAPLPLAEPHSGDSVALLGFPENGPFDVKAARLGRTSEVRTEDAYGRGPVSRQITSLRGLVRSGNSGGPVVDGKGRVVTTVFATTVGGGARAGFGVPDSIVSQALANVGGEVGTGPCAH